MRKVIVSGMKRRVIEIWKKSKIYQIIDNYTEFDIMTIEIE